MTLALGKCILFTQFMVLTLVCFEDIFACLSVAPLLVSDQPFNLGGVIAPTQRFYLETPVQPSGQSCFAVSGSGSH